VINRRLHYPCCNLTFVLLHGIATTAPGADMSFTDPPDYRCPAVNRITWHRVVIRYYMLSHKVPYDIVSENGSCMIGTKYIVIFVAPSDVVQVKHPVFLISRMLRGRFDDLHWLGLLAIILFPATFNVDYLLASLVVHMCSQRLSLMLEQAFCPAVTSHAAAGSPDVAPLAA
jgi:hypothetical protein